MDFQVLAQLDTEKNYVIRIGRDCLYVSHVLLICVSTSIPQPKIHMLKAGPLGKLLILESFKKLVSLGQSPIQIRNRIGECGYSWNSSSHNKQAA